MKWPYHEYQLDAIRFAIAHPRSGLFLEPGLGKTSIILSAFNGLQKIKAVKKMMVVAPLRVIYTTWPNEIRHWDHLNHLTHVIVHGRNMMGKMQEDVDVYLINPEGIKWLESHRKHMRKDIDMIVFDESTKFKDPRTQRFGSIRRILMNTDQFKRRHLLSGTPIPNTLADIWGQDYLLNEGEVFGASFDKFHEKHFEINRYTFRSQPYPESEKWIMEKLGEYCMMLKNKDYIKLPDLIENVITVMLPTKHRKMYDKLEKEFFVMLDNGEDLMASSAQALLMKLRQIASGAVYYDEEHNWTRLHDEKIQVIEELMEESGAPMLLVYEFRHELKRLREKFKEVPAFIDGDAEQLVEEWNNGDIPILALHRATSHGLNLQSAPNSRLCWMSPTYSSESYIQMNARLHRQGREMPVIVHKMITKDTIEEAIQETLARKIGNQEAFMDEIGKYRQRRGI